MDYEPLTGMDYLTKSEKELRKPKDFSPHALRIITAISQMNTKQIEKIDLIGGKNRG